ncbi:MAG TPA: hypothetical protein VF665_18980, partial [Longimicrobium sp.]|uniref:hypothetical protein n=1 Tax=Longimicrobium sp. TaxID=2029185 RepID=UPI002ED9A948
AFRHGQVDAMNRPRRRAGLLLALFLAFAPPGTLIGLVLALAYVGRRHPALAALPLAAAAGWLAWRRLRRRGG